MRHTLFFNPSRLKKFITSLHRCHPPRNIACFFRRDRIPKIKWPDIDAIYMGAVQALTGSGGWPLNVWLTPDRKPFYGGTYFPARDGDRGAGVGFLSLLRRINDVYRAQPDRVEKTSQNLTNILQQRLGAASGGPLPGAVVMHQAIKDYKRVFDNVSGGVTGAPKFPSSLPVRLLLRYHRRTDDPETLQMVRLTLEKMAAGGIYDQVGGGFHRYATDTKWLVPHFEKMLYDNALLIMTYLEGYQATGDEAFKRIVTEVLAYVTREMTSPGGAFFSATDADSLNPDGHREEGYFFTWTPEEMETVLGRESAEIIKTYYAVGVVPDFENRHILHTPRNVGEVADALKLPEARLRAVIEKSKTRLYRFRNARPRPLRDEKIITAWNGLMISAHARAGLILGDLTYTEQAVKAANFILANLFINKRLYRSYKDNQAKHRAFLDDYAFLGAALLDLYEATQDIMWLKKAIELDEILERNYEDKQAGGFFMTGKQHEALIARQKPKYDGAEPSGNSIAILNLLRLGEFTTKDVYRKRAEKSLKTFLGGDSPNPLLLSEMMLAFDFFSDNPKEIVIVAPRGKLDEADPFLQAFRKQFLPNRILVIAGEGEDLESHARIIPLAMGKTAINGKTTAYVCEKGNCKLPALDPKSFTQQLAETVRLPDTP